MVFSPTSFPRTTSLRNNFCSNTEFLLFSAYFYTENQIFMCGCRRNKSAHRKPQQPASSVPNQTEGTASLLLQQVATQDQQQKQMQRRMTPQRNKPIYRR